MKLLFPALVCLAHNANGKTNQISLASTLSTTPNNTGAKPNTTNTTVPKQNATSRAAPQPAQAVSSDGFEYNEFGERIKSIQVYTEQELAAQQAIYPQGLFTLAQINHGASILYLIGIVYCFFGIQLATQNYINPAIDIIKKKNLLGAELMNVSLLAMSNSLAESFIIVNSIFFGVSDIGISTVVQQAAFYGLVNQGMFYLIVAEGTLIDWWIVSRETAFFLLYLAIMTVLLQGNQVGLSGALILFLLYIVHIFLMKYSSKYELVIKKMLAQRMEIKELNRLANNGEIFRFHQNLKNQAVCIEQLNKIDFSVIDGHIVFNQTHIKYKLHPIVCVKLGEEQFATNEDRHLTARLNFKRAVTQIIVKLQAYKFNLYVIRTQKCKQSIRSMLPLMPEHHLNDELYFGEDYYSENDFDQSDEEHQIDPYAAAERIHKIKEQNPITKHTEYVDKFENPRRQKTIPIKFSIEPIQTEVVMTPHRHQADPMHFGAKRNHHHLIELNKIEYNSEVSFRTNNPQQDVQAENVFTEQAFIEEDPDTMWQEYKDHPQPVQLAQTIVYDLILKNVYKDKKSFLQWPKEKRCIAKTKYILQLPHVALQYCSVPNPMVEGREQFYPLTLVAATIWIWVYSFLIVWWTFAITISYNLHFSILPMCIYPFGIVLRDIKKLDDMKVCVAVFKKHCSDQRMGLAETFSGPIFQITGLMGLAWSAYLSTTNESISFINDGIQYQFPLLFATILVKYIFLALNGYKTSKRLFWTNLGVYLVYMLFIILIDYRSSLF